MKSHTSAPARATRNFVDGQFIDATSRTWQNLSPVDGSLVTVVDEADKDTVDRAVAAARQALDGPWGRMGVTQRAALLRRAADLVEDRFDEFVAAECADTGRPVQLARDLDVPRAIANLRAFADIVGTTGHETFLTETARGQALNYTVGQPLGVVAVIVPWNLPLLLLTWKIGPALACGNTVVVKPSEATPSSATLLAEVLDHAGAPAGTYNVVHGFGSGSAGEHLVTHPGIDGVTFTGSTTTGTGIMRAVAPRVRPVSFELGGKNAALVFSDADIETTLEGLARSTFYNTGQVCLCTERIYVQRPVFDDICAGLSETAREIRLGAPTDPNTTHGPLISHKHRQKVLSYFDLATSEGAMVLTGGGIPDVGDDLAGGAWIQPTLWTGLAQTHRTAREEIFGPAAALIPFDDEAEAVKLANDTDYGLAASVWTNDLRRGHRVAQSLRVGVSWVNTWFLRDLRTPFGGVGLSGIGREGGRHSLDFYTQTTNVCIAP